MQQEIVSTLQEILTIIGFRDDKEKFIQGFLLLIQKKALFETFSSLPKEKQTGINDQLQTNNEQEHQKVFTMLINEAGFQDQLVKAARESLDAYLKEILPTLNGEQLDNLDTYFSKRSSDIHH